MSAPLAMEEVVAVIPNQNIDGESELAKVITGIEFKAESISISNEGEFEEAANFGRFIKAKLAYVTEFFKPMKEQAHKAHKAVCEREKQMLTPLLNAEKIIKQTIGEYSDEQERKRREFEEKMRQQAQAEIDKKLEEAAQREESGDVAGSESALSEAQTIERLTGNMTVAESTPQVKGVSTKKDWEIVSVNGPEVPLSIAGIEIRPVDTAAVMRLIRASKGSIEIPGIQYRETTSVSLRK